MIFAVGFFILSLSLCEADNSSPPQREQIGSRRYADLRTKGELKLNVSSVFFFFQSTLKTVKKKKKSGNIKATNVPGLFDLLYLRYVTQCVVMQRNLITDDAVQQGANHLSSENPPFFNGTKNIYVMQCDAIRHDAMPYSLLRRTNA